MKAKCCHCGKFFEIDTGAYNRAVKRGMNVYCSRKHSGIGRRVNKTKAQKRADKAEYDREYRRNNVAMLKEKKATWFKKDYAANPDKYRKQRIRKRKYQREFCRQPEYRKWKQQYDEKHRAKKEFGEHAESFLIIKQIQQIVDSQQARFDKNCHNKTQKRRKLCKSSQQ